MHKPWTRPATWPWLLAHELRLAWRGRNESKMALLSTIVGLAWVLLHLFAWRVMRGVALASLMGSSSLVFIGVGAIFWFMATMILSFAISWTVASLYDRGDLDLLMSSPIDVRTVFIVRGIGIALQSILWPTLIVLPFAHGGIVRGQWGLLATYPTLLALGLGVTALAFGLTLALVKLLGVRRARMVAQVIGAISGALLFLLTQAHNLLPKEFAQVLLGGFRDAIAHGWLSATSILWWPIRAFFGDPLPFLFMLGASATFFLLMIHVASTTFLQGTQDALSVVLSRKPPLAVKSARFHRGLPAIVIRKELLLIARDPQLITQSLLQTLYVVPLMVAIVRHGDAAHMLAPAIVLMAATLAANLAFITVCGEEAPELAGSAPVSLEQIRWLKVAAALLPVCVLAAPFAVYYLIASPKDAFIFVAMLAFALASVSVVQIWCGKPVGTRDLKQRGKSNPVASVLDAISAFAWAGATYGLMVGSWFAWIGIAVGAAVPLWAWFFGERESNSPKAALPT